MWVKLDDEVFSHPKVIDLSKDAKLLWLCGLTHCGHHLTDGFISRSALRLVAATVDVSISVAAVLVEAGLWHPEAEGYRVHDWSDYNPSAEQVKRDREKTAARVKDFRERQAVARNAVTQPVTNGHRNGVGTPLPVPVPVPVPEPDPLPPSAASCQGNSGLHERGREDGRRTTASELRKAINETFHGNLTTEDDALLSPLAAVHTVREVLLACAYYHACPSDGDSIHGFIEEAPGLIRDLHGDAQIEAKAKRHLRSVSSRGHADSDPDGADPFGEDYGSDEPLN